MASSGVNIDKEVDTSIEAMLLKIQLHCQIILSKWKTTAS